MSDREKYINQIRAELVMSGYLNGWEIQWYQAKLEELLNEQSTKK